MKRNLNLWELLKASKGIPVADPMAVLWGYQYRKKHGVAEISGVPPLNFTSRGRNLIDYHIYGNTVQDDTPTPETPVEVLGCGEYDSEFNGYKIPVTVSDSTNSITTPVYIDDKPLHKIGDYADYVDFERGVVVRRIKKIILRDDGLLNFYNFRKNTAGNVWRCDISFGSVYGRGVFTEISNTIPRKSSHFSPGPFSSGVGGVLGSYSNYLFCPVFSLSTIGATGETDSNIIQEHFLNWLDAQYEAGTPVNVWYALAVPKEEPIENLLPIQTIKGTNILTVDTTVQPSNMYLKYKR